LVADKWEGDGRGGGLLSDMYWGPREARLYMSGALAAPVSRVARPVASAGGLTPQAWPVSTARWGWWRWRIVRLAKPCSRAAWSEPGQTMRW